MKWTLSQEVIDYSGAKRVTTVTSSVVEADSCVTDKGTLCFYNKDSNEDEYDEVLVFATNQWDTVKLNSEE